MKLFLSLVIVALLGLCAWVRFTSTRPSEVHRAIIAGLKDELEQSRAAIDASTEALIAAKGELENMRRRLASLETEAVARSFPPQSGQDQGASTGARPVTAPLVGPTAAPAQGGTLESRLSELEATLNTHRAVIEDRKSGLDRELAALQAKRKSVQNTELHFSEQTARVDVEGNFLGNRGVRTSSADRDRAKAKIADQVAEVDREIAGKQTGIDKALRELESLRESYSRAVARAKQEFGASGAEPARSGTDQPSALQHQP